MFKLENIILWLTIIVFGLFFSMRPAHAEGTLTSTSTSQWHTIPSPNVFYSTGTLACVAYMVSYGYTQTQANTFVLYGTTGCSSPSVGTFPDNRVANTTTQSCPAHSALNGSSCNCSTAFVPDSAGTACVAAPTCTAGAITSSGWYDVPASNVIPSGSTGLPPTTSCSGNCQSSYTGSNVTRTSIVNGVTHYYAQGSYSVTGGTCSSYGTTPQSSVLTITASAPPAPTCATGETYVSYGTMGYVCALNTVLNGTASGTPTAAVVVGTMQSPAAGTPTYSVTAGSSTSYVDGSGVTHQTTTSSSLNPALTIPDDLAKTGDISSQTAAIVDKLEATKNECSLHPTSTGCLESGTPTDEITLGTQSVSVGITPVDFGVAASCPADRHIYFQGHDIVFSFAPYCNFLTLLKPIILAFSWLGAAFVIFA